MQRGDDLFSLDAVLAVWARAMGLDVYDFDFRRYLDCRSLRGPVEVPMPVVARVGAIPQYEDACAEMAALGLRLVHSPEEHLRASTLPGWYARIAELTPRSVVFDRRPSAAEIEAAVGLPAFVKGERQTSRHRRSLAVVERPADVARVFEAWDVDPVLGWQRVVCREWVPLRVVDGAPRLDDRMPTAYELRAFFWRGELVGHGRYWWNREPYAFSPREVQRALEVADRANQLVDVPFLVVDVAQTADDRFLVIECNDGQESGYAGASPHRIWAEIVRVERGRASGADPAP